jgi:hypothetical protein
VSAGKDDAGPVSEAHIPGCPIDENPGPGKQSANLINGGVLGTPCMPVEITVSRVIPVSSKGLPHKVGYLVV